MSTFDPCAHSCMRPDGGARVFRLGVLATDGCMMSSIAAATDTLRVAQTLARIRSPNAELCIEAVVIGARGQSSVRMANGLDLAGLVPAPGDLDMVLVPGLMHSSPHDLVERVRSLGPEMDLLRALHLRGVPIAATCSGSLLLAETGLLDGHRATCSWWLAAAFRLHYPDVRLEADAMVVEDGSFLTAGGGAGVVGRFHGGVPILARPARRPAFRSFPPTRIRPQCGRKRKRARYSIGVIVVARLNSLRKLDTSE